MLPKVMHVAAAWIQSIFLCLHWCIMNVTDLHHSDLPLFQFIFCENWCYFRLLTISVWMIWYKPLFQFVSFRKIIVTSQGLNQEISCCWLHIPEHGGFNLVTVILGHDAGVILEVSYILLFLQLSISLIAYTWLDMLAAPSKIGLGGVFSGVDYFVNLL